MHVVLGSVYAGNIDYFTSIKNADSILLDVHEHFVKQSYRNRCEIYGANGKLSLIIPIQRKSGKTPIKEVKIDYSQNWQKIHWKSYESSYRSSPYFEFYEDRFIHLFQKKKIKYLAEFNMHLQDIIFNILDFDKHIKLSERYQKEWVGHLNLRTVMHPKKLPSTSFQNKIYTQVFEERSGFISNLSILDLVFNHGPASYQYI